MKYLVTGFVALLVFFTMALNDAKEMQACEKTHSHDVCFHELNR